MAIKTKEIKRLKNMNDKLREMNARERQKVAGHEELANIQTAYIALLLKKLGADKDNAVTITKEDVSEVIAKDIVRVGFADVGVFKFYVEESEA